jgi:hypothetical protein
MIDRRIAFAAGVTLALLAARVSAQSCTVTLVYPAETLSLSSESCVDAWVCMPGGCVGRLYLAEPINVTVGSDVAPWQDNGQGDSVAILTDQPGNQIAGPGHLIWVSGSDWVFDVSNTVFTGGFDQ